MTNKGRKLKRITAETLIITSKKKKKNQHFKQFNVLYYFLIAKVQNSDCEIY